jgi:hypothetical protein
MSWSKSSINSSNANRLSPPSADSSGGLFAVKDQTFFNLSDSAGIAGATGKTA